MNAQTQAKMNEIIKATQTKIATPKSHGLGSTHSEAIKTMNTMKAIKTKKAEQKTDTIATAQPCETVQVKSLQVLWHEGSEANNFEGRFFKCFADLKNVTNAMFKHAREFGFLDAQIKVTWANDVSLRYLLRVGEDSNHINPETDLISHLNKTYPHSQGFADPIATPDELKLTILQAIEELKKGDVNAATATLINSLND